LGLGVVQKVICLIGLGIVLIACDTPTKPSCLQVNLDPRIVTLEVGKPLHMIASGGDGSYQFSLFVGDYPHTQAVSTVADVDFITSSNRATLLVRQLNIQSDHIILTAEVVSQCKMSGLPNSRISTIHVIR
jgi:hypothetical protein